MGLTFIEGCKFYILLHVHHFPHARTCLIKRTASEPGVVVKVVMHCAQARVFQEVGDTGRRPVNDGRNSHGIGMLPLVSGQCRNVLPDKSSYDSPVIEDLERQNRVASLVRGVVKLKVVITHTKEAEVIIPIGGHISLSLCEWNADEVIHSSILDEKTITCPVVVPVARAPSAIADDKGVDKVSCSEPSHLPHPHVLHIHSLLGEVIDGHIDVPLQQDGLNPRDVSCVVVDDHQRWVRGIRISVAKELAVALSNLLPSSRGSLRLSAGLLGKSRSKWVQAKCCPQIGPVLLRGSKGEKTKEDG